MLKKEITETKTFYECENCHSNQDSEKYFNKCEKCGKEICQSCENTVTVSTFDVNDFTPEDSQIVEYVIAVCDDCYDKIEKYEEDILKILNKCKNEIDKLNKKYWNWD